MYCYNKDHLISDLLKNDRKKYYSYVVALFNHLRCYFTILKVSFHIQAPLFLSLPTKKILEEQTGHAQFSTSVFGSWQSFKEHALFLYAIRCARACLSLGRPIQFWGLI